MINIDLTQNPKQAQFFDVALRSALGKTDYRYLNYGGAVRGGKTYVTLATLIMLARIFPNSRSHTIRESFPVLQGTTIPSFEKLISGSSSWGFNRDKSNYFAYNRKTDSRIYFKAENISNDPELNAFLGLETNFIFLEQSEELSKKLWEKALERVGSWYIDPMPKGLIFQTFNPTQRWVKELIYEPYLKGELPPKFFFLPALPSENPFVTEDQWSSWEQMAERYYLQFIDGDWTNFDGEDNRFCFAFKDARHTGDVAYNPKEPLYLSFDFNRNPIVASAWQHYNGVIYGVDLIELKDATIYMLCEEILSRYGDAMYFVTGDVSGKSATTLSHLNNFDVIKSMLGLTRAQMKYEGSNPRLEDSRQLVNTIFERYPIILDREKCKPLIFDLNNVKVKADGTINKDSRAKEEQRADSLDTMRYYIHRYFRDIVKLIDN